MPSFVYIFFVFSFLFLLSMTTIVPSGNRHHVNVEENDRIRDLLSEAFPLSKYIVTFSAFLSGGYIFVLYILMQNDSMVEYFFEGKNYFIIFMVFVVFCGILSFFFLKEYKNVNNELKAKRPYLLLSSILLSLSLSGMMTISFISSTNKLLDFSKPSEEIITIEDMYSRSGQKSETRFYISFKPSVFNHYYFQIPSDKYSLIKKGDKVKIIIHNGFWGIKYTNFELETVK